MAKRLDQASALGGAVGAALILLSFAALVLGVFGAYYLDRTAAPPTQQIVQKPGPLPAAPTAEAPTPTPAGAIESPHEQTESIPPDTVRMLDGITPTAGPPEPKPLATQQPQAAPPAEPAPAPTREPAPEPVPATPAATAPVPPDAAHDAETAQAPSGTAQAPPAPGFTVDYATYGRAHRHFAEQLAAKLSGLGIEAAVTDAKGPAGRALLMVASTADGRAAAERAASIARHRLHLHPVVLAQAQSAPTPSSGTTSPQHPYWLQIAAYDRPPAAQRLQQRLASRGIETSLVSRHRPDGRKIVLVRSMGLADRDAAQSLADRVQRIIGPPPALVGHDSGPPRPHHHHHPQRE